MFCKNCGVENTSSNKFCKSCGKELSVPQVIIPNVKKDSSVKKALGSVGGVVAFIIAYALVRGLFSLGATNSQVTSNQNLTPSPVSVQTPIQKHPLSTSYVSQSTIASSMVNILCPTSDGGGTGGSGSIVNSKGLILTNNHIIPEDNNGNPTISICYVTLPNAQTGQVERIYQAEPVTIPTLSKQYDLAFMNINSSYTDDAGKTYGDYPTVFTNIIDQGCENDSPALGESIKVYGYPAISGGGYSLTITEGLVSSLPNDGTIVTSAKVDHGSSGGLAVDKNGCYIGVPSMISGDGNESLGVLISNSVIAEFFGKVSTLLNQ